ncbi:MAG: bifunctional DNA primase/polymerase [Pseudomonadota bacterium]
MTSPFKSGAPTLRELGYHTIPIMPAGKFPAWIRDRQWVHTVEWQKWRDEMPNEDDFVYWSTMPRANLGVVLGTPVGEYQLVAVDIDVVDPDEVAELLSTLPRSPMEKRGAKGTTVFFLANPNVRSRGYRTKDKVPLADLLTGNATKQTVMPPSVHPDGPVYEWVGDGPVPIDELPVLTADHLEQFHEMLESLGWKEGAEGESDAFGNRQKIAKSADFSDDPFAAVKVDALANLDLWVPDLTIYGLDKSASGYRAVPDFRPSGSGNRTEDRKRSLSITPNGIKDHGDDRGYSAIDLVMATEKLGEAEACKWLEDRLYTDQITTAQIIAGPDYDDDDDDDEDEDEEIVEASDAHSFELVKEVSVGDRWTEFPKFCDPITALAEYIHDNQNVGLDAFALAASLVTVSTAIGRQYKTPYMDGALNLYFLGLAPSGAGKTQYIKGPSALLSHARLSTLIGPSEWTAGTVFENYISMNPTALCLIDEFGDTMQRMTDPKASPAQQSRAKPIKEMYSVGFGNYETSQMAARASMTIPAPHLSIFAMSTPDKLYSNISEEQLEEGFVNRWLMLPINPKRMTKEERRRVECERALKSGGLASPPAHLVRMLKGIHDGPSVPKDENYFNEATNTVTTSAAKAPDPKQIEWGSDEVLDLYVEYMLHCKSDEVCRTEIIRNLYARAAENALRVACVLVAANHAYKGSALSLGLDELTFAIRFVDWCVRLNLSKIEQGIGGGSKTAKVQFQIITYVKKRHRTYRELYNNFRTRVDGGPRGMKDLLELLVHSGMIKKTEKPNKRGRPTEVYVITNRGKKTKR